MRLMKAAHGAFIKRATIAPSLASAASSMKNVSRHVRASCGLLLDLALRQVLDTRAHTGSCVAKVRKQHSEALPQRVRPQQLRPRGGNRRAIFERARKVQRALARFLDTQETPVRGEELQDHIPRGGHDIQQRDGHRGFPPLHGGRPRRRGAQRPRPPHASRGRPRRRRQPRPARQPRRCAPRRRWD